MVVMERESVASGYRDCVSVARVVLLLLTLCSCPHSLAAELATTPSRPLRVATGMIAPFVLKEGDKLTGFSVE
jgi:hypothetical protein